MSRIITYKEGCYSQIKLTSGESVMLSCAEGGTTIFQMRFLGLFPGPKIGEWKQKDLAGFMVLFGGCPSNVTPFKWTVDRLTSFDSIEHLREFVTHGIGGVGKECPEGEKKRETFDSFMMARIVSNPTISIDAGLEEYIEKHNLAVHWHPDEPVREAATRTMLQVLEESSLTNDCKDPQFVQYLSGLRRMVQLYDTMSPQARRLMKEEESRR